MEGFWISGIKPVQTSHSPHEGSLFIITEVNIKELEEINMVNENLKRLSELVPQSDLKGENVPIDEIENKDIVLQKFESRQSRMSEGGRYARIQALDGNRQIIFTASETVLKRLEELIEQHGEDKILNTIVTISKRKSAAGRNYWWIN